MMRDFKDWFEKETTDKERKVIDTIDLNTNINENIDKLNILSKHYSPSGSSHDFFQ